MTTKRFPPGEWMSLISLAAWVDAERPKYTRDHLSDFYCCQLCRILRVGRMEEEQEERVKNLTIGLASVDWLMKRYVPLGLACLVHLIVNSLKQAVFRRRALRGGESRHTHWTAPLSHKKQTQCSCRIGKHPSPDPRLCP